MMKSFLVSGSLTWGMELDEDTGRTDTMPFLEEVVSMMVYNGRPHQGGATCLT
jgi:hypothetical protein